MDENELRRKMQAGELAANNGTVMRTLAIAGCDFKFLKLKGLLLALDTREALRWRLDSEETLEPSRVLFRADGTWHVLGGPLAAFAGCPVRMERRQRRAYVTAELGGAARRVRFGVIPVTEGGGP